MAKYNFSEQLKGDGSFTNERFKFVEGRNAVRVLSESAIVLSHFLGKGAKPATCYGIKNGCPRHDKKDEVPGKKWVVWVLDRADGKIKTANFPYKVIQAVADLQNNEDFSLDEVPMPYDIVINATNAGTKEVVYSVTPRPARTPLTNEELLELSSKTPVTDIVSRMKEKQRKLDESDGTLIYPIEIEGDPLEDGPKELGDEIPY